MEPARRLYNDLIFWPFIHDPTCPNLCHVLAWARDHSMLGTLIQPGESSPEMINFLGLSPSELQDPPCYYLIATPRGEPRPEPPPCFNPKGMPLASVGYEITIPALEGDWILQCKGCIIDSGLHTMERLYPVWRAEIPSTMFPTASPATTPNSPEWLGRGRRTLGR